MSKQSTLAALVTVLSVLCIPAATFAQQPSTPNKPVSPKTVPPPSAKQPFANPGDAVQQRLDSIDQAIRESDVDSRLTQIENAIKDLKQSSMLSTLLPALIAAIAAIVGVLVGGFVNDRLQRARLVQEEKAASAKAEHSSFAFCSIILQLLHNQ
jgi:hypothetical protein